MLCAERAVGEDCIPYNKRRWARAYRARELGATATAWERACRAYHGCWGHVRRDPESPASVPAHWRGPRWWRTARALQVDGPTCVAHPRKERPRPPQFERVASWARGAIFDLALKCGEWARSRRGPHRCSARRPSRGGARARACLSRRGTVKRRRAPIIPMACFLTTAEGCSRERRIARVIENRSVVRVSCTHVFGSQRVNPKHCIRAGSPMFQGRGTWVEAWHWQGTPALRPETYHRAAPPFSGSSSSAGSVEDLWMSPRLSAG